MSKLSKVKLKEINDAAHNRREIIAAGLSRREMVKMGLLSAVTGMLLPIKGLSARATDPKGMTPLLNPVSPPTTPWMEFMPHVNMPPYVKTTVGAVSGPPPTQAPNTAINTMTGLPYEGRTLAHQAWTSHPVVKYYETHQAALANVICHPNLAPQQGLWGFDGKVPGPTYRNYYGQPCLVRNYNDLPPLPASGGFGMNEVSTHLHNGHNPPESDGNPCYSFKRGQYYDYHYPMMYAGNDPNEAMSTLWYHDHMPSFTAQNTYKGLVGFHLYFNNQDTGDETTGFRLPSNEFDVPMIFADKLFENGGAQQMFYDLFNLDGILGDKVLVNGKIQPKFEVKARRYRFRFLVGGPSRFFQFHITDPTMTSTNNKSTNQSLPFWVISSDGNLLPNPVQVPNVRLAVAERVDIVIDFTGMAGKTFYIENRLEQTNGRGPTGNILTTNPNNYLVKLQVVGTATDNSLPVNASRTFYTLPPKNLTPRVTREFKFERKNGQWAINGKFFDHTCGPNVVRFRMKRGFPEHFIFKNSSGGWQHPIHVHTEEFQAVLNNGNPVTAVGFDDNSNIFGRKDVWRLRHNDEVKVQYQVRDWLGMYPMHCHNTVHEDHEMMLMYEINTTGDNITKP